MSISDSFFVNRRNFLKSSVAGLVFLPRSDFKAVKHENQAVKAKVALIKTSDRKRGVSQAMKLLDLSGINNKRVMLKPNFNSDDLAPGSTHNDTLTQLIHEIRERGARDITLGESSGPPANSTRGVMERKGIFDMARDERFSVINYEEIPDGDWVQFSSDQTHWTDGYYLPRQAVNAEYLVSTPCIKTHRLGVFTMSLKLSVGLTPKPIRRPMHRSPDMRKMIAELNLGYKPQLIVMDGIDVFVDGGPSRGERKQGNVIIAGADRVAVDAAGIAVLKELGSNDRIMNRKIFDQEQINRAAELNIGIGSPEQIEFVTPDDDSRQYADKLKTILAQG